MPGGPAGGAHASRTARRKAGLGKYKPQYRNPVRRAPAPRRSSGLRRQTPKEREWSNLILQSVRQVTDPLGNIMHVVKPMNRDEKKDQMQTWRDARGGKVSDEQKQADTYYTPEEATRFTHAERRAGASPKGARDKALARTLKDRGRATREQVLDQAKTITLDDLKKEVEPMTWEEFDALTPRQRMAVEFNTLLTDAVRRDLQNQDVYEGLSEKETSAYDKAEEMLFGEDRGSDMYAPETVALLKKLGQGSNQIKGLEFKDSLADLDDYLGLKVAITEKDLKNFGKGNEANFGRSSIINNEDLDMNLIQDRMVTQTEAMAKSMARTKNLLETYAASAQLDISGEVTKFGGESPAPVDGSLGWGSEEIDSAFNTLFEGMASREQGVRLQDVEEYITQEFTPQQRNAFLDYVDRRSRQTAELGAPLIATDQTGKPLPDNAVRSPEEFRRIFRLGD